MKDFFGFNKKENLNYKNFSLYDGFNLFRFFGNKAENYKKNFRQVNNLGKFKRIAIFFLILILGIIAIYVFSFRVQYESSNNISSIGNTMEQNLSENTSLSLKNTKNNSLLFGNQSALMVKMLIGLIVIACLIYITVYILKFFYYKRAGIVNNNLNKPNLGIDLVEVLESKSIDLNKKLFLIGISNKVLLISSTDNNLSLLYELTDEEAEKIFLRIKNSKSESSTIVCKQDFKSFFSKFLNN